MWQRQRRLLATYWRQATLTRTWQGVDMAEIVLIRHGETEWSKSGQHTGRTDIPLTRNGRKRAAELEPLFRHRAFGLTLSSPMERARDTAALAGLKPDGIDNDLVAINANSRYRSEGVWYLLDNSEAEALVLH